jgi:fatty-acyl-CoA synthase
MASILMQTSDGTNPGLMMDGPLTVPSILRRAVKMHPDKEIVSRFSDGSIHRYTYADLYRRVLRLMSVLRTLGVRPGDRVATFAWNSHRHLELYFAVPALGAVLHTVNIRLFPQQIAYILNHAEDKLIFADLSLGGIVAQISGELKSVEASVLMNDLGEAPAALPEPAFDYEELMAAAPELVQFPELDERAAARLVTGRGACGIRRAA